MVSFGNFLLKPNFIPCMPHSDQDIVHKLYNGDQSALKYLFDEYYNDLVIHALKIVVNKGVAEEIVQDVLIQLWKNRVGFILQKTFHAYLFTAVRNRSINFLKSKYGRTRFEELDRIDQYQMTHSADEQMNIRELRQAIHGAIQLLPPKCKLIFHLSRNADLSVDEIAFQLDLSKKTVQTQISIAIKKIRAHLENQWGHLL